MPETPRFTGGANIALKIPKFKYQETFEFYHDTLGLPYLGECQGSHQFRFGSMCLWLDLVESYSQSDVWLELYTEDPQAATDYLRERGVPVRDEVEELADSSSHWISDPAGVIHLVNRTGE